MVLYQVEKHTFAFRILSRKEVEFPQIGMEVNPK